MQISGAVPYGESDPHGAGVDELGEVSQGVVEGLFVKLPGRRVHYDGSLLRHLQVWTSLRVQTEIPGHVTDRPVLVVLKRGVLGSYRQ